MMVFGVTYADWEALVSQLLMSYAVKQVGLVHPVGAIPQKTSQSFVYNIAFVVMVTIVPAFLLMSEWHIMIM